MATVFPPTVLVNGSAQPVPQAAAQLLDNNNNPAVVFTDPSGEASMDNLLNSDQTGTVSPTSNPVYVNPGTYTLSYQDGAGVARTLSVTVGGTAPASSLDPSAAVEAAQIKATGAAVTTAQAAGGAAALPATPKGYLPAVVNGVTVVIPFY